MPRSPDVIIVGGGAIGCALAYYLAGGGAQVTVLERGRAGSGASSAAAGMLAPLAEATERGPFQSLCLSSLALFPVLAAELEATTGIGIELDRCGILRVATTVDGAAALRQVAAQAPEAFRVLEADELRKLEPVLTPLATMALLSSQEAQVSAPRFTQALASAAAQRGAVLREGEPAVGLLRQGARVTGVVTRKDKLQAAHVVLASGAWTGGLATELLGRALPVMPRKGQIVAVQAPRPGLRHIAFAEGGYLTPKSDGAILIGATDEDAGFDTANTVEGVRGLLGFAKRAMPALAEAPIRGMWAGLRPGSGDGHPILGPLPGADGLWVASGHYRNGILLAPVTGKVMAEWMLQGKPSTSLEAFSPGRFGG